MIYKNERQSRCKLRHEKGMKFDISLMEERECVLLALPDERKLRLKTKDICQ